MDLRDRLVRGSEDPYRGARWVKRPRAPPVPGGPASHAPLREFRQRGLDIRTRTCLRRGHRLLRGRTLYEEPAYDAPAGLFWNPGFANGINLNYSLGHGFTAYGSLRNALDWHYEEAYGYPSPLLNFMAGLKWRLP